jgi:hypothetical protein
MDYEISCVPPRDWILQRTNACRGASRLAVHVPGPIATEGEIDDDIVSVKMLRKIALCVGEMSSRSPLYQRRISVTQGCMWRESARTQASVLTVCAPFLRSEGVDPLFLDQNQTLMKLLLRSIASHPPPLLLKEGPKLFPELKETPQPVLLFAYASQFN